MEDNSNRERIPAKIDRGRHHESDVSALIHMYERHHSGKESGYTAKADRYACGLPIPDFQREFCWNEQQQIKFVESVWLGLPLGSYIFVELNWNTDGSPTPFSGWLIDGQQRLITVQRYLEDQFKVFGLYYSELTKREKHRFEGIKFTHYEIQLDDKRQIIDLYNRLAFGGTPHKESERAISL